jgi:dTDP-4-dehydrorhamnose 3,5-epimerase
LCRKQGKVPFTFSAGPIEGLVIIQPQVFPDDRGLFFESYKASDFRRHGITAEFVQDNHSSSSRSVLRGLHFQDPPSAQGKLVRVIKGAAWDVAVDLRPRSSTYLEWFGLEISEANRTMLYVPPGFAHGFLTISDQAEFLYKCTAEYDKDAERGIRWDDPDIGIRWPEVDIIVSERDAALPFAKDVP